MPMMMPTMPLVENVSPHARRQSDRDLILVRPQRLGIILSFGYMFVRSLLIFHNDVNAANIGGGEGAGKGPKDSVRHRCRTPVPPLRASTLCKIKQKCNEVWSADSAAIR